MYSKKIEEYKKTLRLTKRQRDIIVGTLLGDGHLETQNKGRTYRLKIEHSIKQKEYVDWLYKELKSWVESAPRVRRHAGASGLATTYGFTTYSHGALRFYGQQFYTKEGKKILPRLIGKLLRPLSIAIWYLDDGSVKSNRHKTFIIHSHGYTKQELKRIQEILALYGIKTSLHRQIRQTGRYWRIYILSESAEMFVKIVKPIINQIPVMKYKLGNTMPKK